MQVAGVEHQEGESNVLTEPKSERKQARHVRRYSKGLLSTHSHGFGEEQPDKV